MIVIGYSGRDKSLMDALKELSQKKDQVIYTGVGMEKPSILKSQNYC